MTDLNPPAFCPTVQKFTEQFCPSDSDSCSETNWVRREKKKKRKEKRSRPGEHDPTYTKLSRNEANSDPTKAASPPLIRTSIEASPAGLSQGCRHSGNNQICLRAKLCFVGERLHPGRRHVILQLKSTLLQREREREVKRSSPDPVPPPGFNR